MKQILGPESQGIPIESRLISLASWIAKNYGSTMNQALKTVLPVKEKRKTGEEISGTEGFPRGGTTVFGGV